MWVTPKMIPSTTSMGHHTPFPSVSALLTRIRPSRVQMRGRAGGWEGRGAWAATSLGEPLGSHWGGPLGCWKAPTWRGRSTWRSLDKERGGPEIHTGEKCSNINQVGLAVHSFSARVWGVSGTRLRGCASTSRVEVIGCLGLEHVFFSPSCCLSRLYGPLITFRLLQP